MRKALLTYENQKGLYQSKVNSSLASTQKQGHQTHNCKWTIITIHIHPKDMNRAFAFPFFLLVIFLLVLRPFTLFPGGGGGGGRGVLIFYKQTRIVIPFSLISTLAHFSFEFVFSAYPLPPPPPLQRRRPSSHHSLPLYALCNFFLPYLN